MGVFLGSVSRLSLPSTTPRRFFFFRGLHTSWPETCFHARLSYHSPQGRGGHARNSTLYEWCEYYDGHAFRCQPRTMGKVLIARKQRVFFTRANCVLCSTVASRERIESFRCRMFKVSLTRPPSREWLFFFFSSIDPPTRQLIRTQASIICKAEASELFVRCPRLNRKAGTSFPRVEDDRRRVHPRVQLIPKLLLSSSALGTSV